MRLQAAEKASREAEEARQSIEQEGLEEHDSLLADLRDAERQLEERRKQERDLAEELAETEQQLTDEQEKTEQALVQATERLEEIRGPRRRGRVPRSARRAPGRAARERGRARAQAARDADPDRRGRGRAQAAEDRVRSAVREIGRRAGSEPAPAEPAAPGAPARGARARPARRRTEPGASGATASPWTVGNLGPRPRARGRARRRAEPRRREPPARRRHRPARHRRRRAPIPGTIEPPPGGPININTADYDALRSLKLSVTQTGRVLAHRERAGGFASLDELDQIPGFPRAFLDELKRHLTL